MHNIALFVCGAAGLFQGLFYIIGQPVLWGYLAAFCGFTLLALAVVRDYEATP